MAADEPARVWPLPPLHGYAVLIRSTPWLMEDRAAAPSLQALVTARSRASAFALSAELETYRDPAAACRLIGVAFSLCRDPDRPWPITVPPVVTGGRDFSIDQHRRRLTSPRTVPVRGAAENDRQARCRSSTGHNLFYRQGHAMGADYTMAVVIRYLLLAASLAATGWVAVPYRAGVPAVLLVAAYVLLVIHAKPAARYARRAPEPWARWMALYAARTHAFCAAAFVTAWPWLEMRVQLRPEDAGGMRIEVGWNPPPSLLEIGVSILVYTVFSVGLALFAGAESRDRWGVVDPGQHLIRIRRTPSA